MFWKNQRLLHIVVCFFVSCFLNQFLPKFYYHFPMRNPERNALIIHFYFTYLLYFKILHFYNFNENCMINDMILIIAMFWCNDLTAHHDLLAVSEVNLCVRGQPLCQGSTSVSGVNLCVSCVLHPNLPYLFLPISCLHDAVLFIIELLSTYSKGFILH